MNRKIRVVVAILLLINLFYIYVFENWNFTKPIFYNVFWSVHFSLITVLITMFLILKLKSKSILITLCFAICLSIFYFQFNPIDSEEYPHDVKILSSSGDIKLIVRERKDGKTNNIRTDTMYVKDKFIFRKVIRDYATGI